MTKIFEVGQKVRLVGYPFKYGAFGGRPHLEGRIGEIKGVAADTYDVHVEGESPDQFMHPENLEELPEVLGTKPDVFIIDEVEDYPKFSPGDRVRIVGDAYVNHPSRMRGGKGRVEEISHSGGMVKVRVDDDPQDRLWSFFSDEVEKIESLPSLVEVDYGELEQRLLAHLDPSDTTIDDWYFDNDKGVEAEENPGVYFVSVPVPNGMKLESVSLTFA